MSLVGEGIRSSQGARAATDSSRIVGSPSRPDEWQGPAQGRSSGRRGSAGDSQNSWRRRTRGAPRRWWAASDTAIAFTTFVSFWTHRKPTWLPAFGRDHVQSAGNRENSGVNRHTFHPPWPDDSEAIQTPHDQSATLPAPAGSRLFTFCHGGEPPVSSSVAASIADPVRARGSLPPVARVQALPHLVSAPLPATTEPSSAVGMPRDSDRQPPAIILACGVHAARNGSGRDWALFDMSTRNRAASGCWHRKWMACPARRWFKPKGGTAIGSACRSSRALRNRERLAGSARMAKPTSRLNRG